MVILAETCNLAITLFASHLPDVSILDLGLPDMSGMRFLEFVRKSSLSPIIVLSAMKEWIREAGITKNITFHSYRRTYATLQGAAGTDIRTIQSNMAHKSITTTQRYMKVVDSNKREASNRISLIRK